MNIKLKNKFLYFNKYKLRCSIGKSGITPDKKEGDQKTPKGIFKFKSIFYRKDRITNLKTLLKKIIIKKNMGWCDDPNSKYYNKLIKFPFTKRAEKMWLKDKIYDILIVINYNLEPVVKKKGSAIFLHIANKNYASTKGCVAVNKRDMLLLASKINDKSKLIIS
ncbi:MAG: L,D-transpeptidase family protein [Pelagibacteraceae bacterium]|nr:L,D-transpeptidase family protein [Pelagibacteraceae bacterium]